MSISYSLKSGQDSNLQRCNLYDFSRPIAYGPWRFQGVIPFSHYALPNLPIYLDRVVVGTGFEPVWQGWKPCILTPRWTDHLIIVDTVGIEPKRSDCKSVDLPSASGPFEREKGFEPSTASLEGWNSTNWATPAGCDEFGISVTFFYMEEVIKPTDTMGSFYYRKLFS